MDAFADALRPIVERGIEAFWVAVRAELPAGLIDGESPSWNSGEIEELDLRAREAVLFWAFEQWNKDVPLTRLRITRTKPVVGEISNVELDLAGAAK